MLRICPKSSEALEVHEVLLEVFLIWVPFQSFLRNALAPRLQVMDESVIAADVDVETLVRPGPTNGCDISQKVGPADVHRHHDLPRSFLGVTLLRGIQLRTWRRTADLPELLREIISGWAGHPQKLLLATLCPAPRELRTWSLQILSLPLRKDGLEVLAIDCTLSLEAFLEKEARQVLVRASGRGVKVHHDLGVQGTVGEPVP
mmetsp:Transcript_43780/g.102215  ORF Transcript_43780/g.102215 Transcript_43780/m.102215 type:complete len:203 (-) Transcript_43780:1159-1767(-)